MWWKSRKKAASPPEQKNELRESGHAPMSELAKKVKEIELVTRKYSSSQLLGQYKSRFKGQGMQFSDFRVYQYGDDTRHIDWRITARHQEPYVRTFEEERELNIICAVDVSASSLFGTSDLSKREVLCIAIAAIAFSAIASNDRVGMLLFSEDVERYVPPKKGRKHVLRIIDELLAFQPKQKGTNLTKALEFMSGVAKHNSVILLASDYYGNIDRRGLSSLARKHDLIAMHVADPRDTAFPPLGLMQLEDPESGETLLINTSAASFRKQFTEGQKKKLREGFDFLRQAGASLIRLGTHDDPSLEIRRFFHERKRGRR